LRKFDVEKQQWSDENCTFCRFQRLVKKDKNAVVKKILRGLTIASNLEEPFSTKFYSSKVEKKFKVRIGEDEPNYMSQVMVAACEIAEEIQHYHGLSRFWNTIAHVLEQVIRLEENTHAKIPRSEWRYEIVEFDTGHIKIEEPWDQLWFF